MSTIETTGKTIEDAVRSGLVRLGRMKDEVDIEVLEEPKSGFFGFGSKPAKVRITEKEGVPTVPTMESQPAAVEKPVAPAAAEPAANAAGAAEEAVPQVETEPAEAETGDDFTAEEAAAKAKAEKNGCTLGADYVLMKGGQPVRAVRKMTAEEIDLIVRRVARIVKIGMFMDRYPSELSGGQQQRVAIARTLAPNPKVLFMDEPLSNLDAKLRLEMRSELQRLHLQTGSTFVYVTHDQMEAMTLATRICLMENGVLQQYDEPLTVYGEPSNLFVADFVGNPAINFIEAQGAQKQDGTVELTMLDGVKAAYTPGEPVNLREWFAREEKNAAASVDTHAVEKANRDSLFKYHIAKVEEDEFEDEATLTHEDFVIGVRPECVSICENGALEGEIFSAMPTGMETTVKVRVGEFLFTGVVFGGITYKIGQKVRVSFTGENVLLFSRENGKLITRGTLKI